MTVESISSKVFYYGNNHATSFPVPFQYNQTESIRLMLLPSGGDEEEIDTSNFEIVVSEGATSMTYPLSGSPLATGDRLTIFRDTEQSQIVALKFGGAFAPNVLEYDGFDRAVMMIQEIQEEVDRSIKVDISSEITPDELRDNIFVAESAAAASATDSANSATASQISANNSALSAASAAVSAQEALDRMNGTIHKSRVFNVRASWEITSDTASGSLLNLPESYFPTRNHMMLFYNGVLCELKNASGDGMYQYSEVGSVDVLSTQVVIDFTVYSGDRFDMIAIASGVLQNLDTLEQTLTEATALLAIVNEERIPNMTHIMTRTTFVEGVRPGLYHPVHKTTGLPIYSLGLCNGGIYDAVSTTGTVETEDMTDKFVLGCATDASDIGEIGGSDTHTATIKTTNVTVNVHTLTIAEMPAHTHPSETLSTTTSASRVSWGTSGPGILNVSTGSAGGGQGHNHSTTDPGHTHTVTGKPKYIKVAFVVAL